MKEIIFLHTCINNLFHWGSNQLLIQKRINSLNFKPYMAPPDALFNMPKIFWGNCKRFFKNNFPECTVLMDVKIRLVINCMMMLWSVGQTCTSNDKIKEETRKRQKEDIFNWRKFTQKIPTQLTFRRDRVHSPPPSPPALCMCLKINAGIKEIQHQKLTLEI